MQIFITPPPEVQVSNYTWDTVPANYWYITVGAFYDRFRPVKLAVLASEDLVVQGLIKDSAVREYINLKHTDLAEALSYMVSKGVITQAHADSIMSLPTTEDERFVKNLIQPL